MYTANNPVLFSDPSGLSPLTAKARLESEISLKALGKLLVDYAARTVFACGSMNILSYIAAVKKDSAFLITLEILLPSPTPCHLPVMLYPGLRTFAIGLHIIYAQTFGNRPMLLTHEPNGASERRNRQACTAARTNTMDTTFGTSCDEYPFASTLQGGFGASIMGVPESEQNSQGGLLSAFYRYKLGGQVNFAVVVVPTP